MKRKKFLKPRQVTVKNEFVTVYVAPWCRPNRRRYIFPSSFEASDYAKKLCKEIKQHKYPATNRGLREAEIQIASKE